MSFIFYHIFVRPLSYLPIKVIYVLTDIGGFFIYHLFKYRRKIVLYNLKHSFPEKTNQEIRIIAKKYYRHLTDVLAEGVKNLNCSEDQLLKHIRCEDTAIMDDFFKAGKSVLLVSGHYNNWEFMITAQNLLFKHQAVGIGMPMSNGFWDKKINEKRARFGMRIVNANNVREKFETFKDDVTATLILADQSPGDSNKAYWTKFLNRNTGIQFGTEYFANIYNYPVIFFWLEKEGRGKYKVHLELISAYPREEAYGYITEKHTTLLEKVINQAPEYWVWTHKRWKRDVPQDLDKLRKNQEKKFNERFRS